MTDLSLLIPARNEMFLSRTIDDLLAHAESDFEIIAVLDGEWAEPAIVQHPRVTVIHYPESIGQRAATNAAARIASGKYVAKVDAHCAFAQGFDRVLLEDMQPDWTIVPIMRNLHVFNWVCKNGHSRYQGPSGPCKECGEPTEMDIVWIAKTNPQSTSYCFDPTPHFQYNGEFRRRKEYKSGIVVGYQISFDVRMISPVVVSLLADFACSHKLSSGTYSLGRGENVTVNTMSLMTVDDKGSIRTLLVDGIGNQFEMRGVATSPVLADVVYDRDISASSGGDRADKPCVSDSMCKLFLAEVGTPSIPSFINSSNPIPASAYGIDSDIVNKLNDILGGKFVYSEKTSSFHNGSVTLDTVHVKHLAESMSLQGSFFMLSRDKYFELNVCDEEFGSWGSQGIEVAVKTWLSGGRVIVDQRTWYAHCFRTQGSDFGFPYNLSGRQVEHAKKMARDIFFNNKWDKQTKPLSWLVKKFWPVPGWTEEALKNIETDTVPASIPAQPSEPEPQRSDETLTKGIVYYTDNRLDEHILHACQEQLLKSANGIPIISVSLQPLDFGTRNIVLPLERGYLTMFKQILTGLEALDSDIVFFCEHDVLYHPSHFAFHPAHQDMYYYNINVWKLRLNDGHLLHYDCQQTSGLCAYRELLLQHYRERVRRVELEGYSRNMGFEAGTNNRPQRVDDYKASSWRSEFPNIDIRHDKNLTPSRWSKDQFRNQRYTAGWKEADEISGWGKGIDLIRRITDD